MAKRPTVHRLIVDAPTAEAVERARIELISRTRRNVTKTSANIALATVALRHLDEVAALLTEGAPEE